MLLLRLCFKNVPKLKLFHKNAFSFTRYQNQNSINQSKYYRPRVNIQQFLISQQLEYRANANVYSLKYCPFCPKPHNNDRSNLFVLSVHKQAGVYFCHRCQARGSWLDLKKAVLGLNDQWFEGTNDTHFQNSLNVKQQKLQLSNVQYFLYQQNIKRQSFKDVRQYLYQRGFNDQTIDTYKIGAGVQSFIDDHGQYVNVKVIYFPMFRMLTSKQLKKKNQKRFQRVLQKQKQRQTSLTDAQLLDNQVEIVQFEQDNFGSHLVELVKLKIRGAGKQNKKYMRQYPSRSQPGFFGLNLIKQTDKTIIITQGQFDAMAVYQATKQPAISLPNGAASLPDSITPFLDQFEKIILWMDNDEVGKIAQQKIAHKLGLTRTYIVHNSNMAFKDANDFLKLDINAISQLIKHSRTIPDQNILTFNSLRQRIKQNLYNYRQKLGYKLSFDIFNKKVKGIRMGQVSIVSGPTGSGKTTLLSQITVDLLKQNIPVLWGSFQIKNQILLANMLIQYSKIDLTRQVDKFDLLADKFDNYPFYCLSFHGPSDIKKALSTIEYGIEKYGISLVVIDTLQFFLSRAGRQINKFDLQDNVMAQLREIATNYNIHIVIVIHPRKTQQTEDIGIHSIYGSSKATQQADNIWIIQNRQHFKIFDIKKNRFDGEIGRAAFGYNRKVRSFFQLYRNQLEGLFRKQCSIEDIIDKRQSNTHEQINSLQDQILEASNQAIDEHEMLQKPKSNKFKNNYSTYLKKQ